MLTERRTGGRTDRQTDGVVDGRTGNQERAGMSGNIERVKREGRDRIFNRFDLCKDNLDGGRTLMKLLGKKKENEGENKYCGVHQMRLFYLHSFYHVS